MQEVVSLDINFWVNGLCFLIFFKEENTPEVMTNEKSYFYIFVTGY